MLREVALVGSVGAQAFGDVACELGENLLRSGSIANREGFDFGGFFQSEIDGYFHGSDYGSAGDWSACFLENVGKVNEAADDCGASVIGELGGEFIAHRVGGPEGGPATGGSGFEDVVEVFFGAGGELALAQVVNEEDFGHMAEVDVFAGAALGAEVVVKLLNGCGGKPGGADDMAAPADEMLTGEDAKRGAGLPDAGLSDKGDALGVESPCVNGCLVVLGEADDLRGHIGFGAERRPFLLPFFDSLGFDELLFLRFQYRFAWLANRRGEYLAFIQKRRFVVEARFAFMALGGFHGIISPVSGLRLRPWESRIIRLWSS